MSEIDKIITGICKFFDKGEQPDFLNWLDDTRLRSSRKRSPKNLRALDERCTVFVPVEILIYHKITLFEAMWLIYEQYPGVAFNKKGS